MLLHGGDDRIAHCNAYLTLWMTQPLSIQPIFDFVTLNEALTRALHIDPQLRAANWKLDDRTQFRLEVPVNGYDAEPRNGVTDCCLYDASGNVLAGGLSKSRVRSPLRFEFL
jgi:hypothetical protein